MAPVRIGDVAELLALIDAEIVDQDFDRRRGLGDECSALRRGGVGQDGADGFAAGCLDVVDCRIEPGLVAAGDDDVSAFKGERASNFKPVTRAVLPFSCRSMECLQIVSEGNL
jgi:hypothetical protein